MPAQIVFGYRREPAQLEAAAIGHKKRRFGKIVFRRDGLRRAGPWYRSLYLRRTERTRQRDLSELRNLKLITVDANGRISTAP